MRRTVKSIALVIQPYTVLVYDNIRQIDKFRDNKLDDRWKGPFIVLKVLPKNAYQLATVEGVPFERIFAATRVKKYLRFDKVYLTEEETETPRPDQTSGSKDSTETLSTDESEASSDGRMPLTYVPKDT